MNQKGQGILSIIVSIAALLGTGTGVSFLYNQFSIANSTIIKHEGRISIVETRIERMPYLEAKLDRLLEKQGINPSTIKVATSTIE